jgi:hypothetical protein
LAEAARLTAISGAKPPKMIAANSRLTAAPL